MEAAKSSETLVNFYQNTKRYNTEDSYLQKESCKNAPTSFAIFVCLNKTTQKPLK
jgi:hypothetical protein